MGTVLFKSKEKRGRENRERKLELVEPETATSYSQARLPIEGWGYQPSYTNLPSTICPAYKMCRNKD